MAFAFRNLDAETRRFMLEELDLDVASDRLYISPRLSEKGAAAYEQLLREAIEDGDEVLLSNTLRSPGLMNVVEMRRRPSGGYTTAKVPDTAPETLAEGEFSRFYARGVCRAALEKGIPRVIVYRAKPVLNPRPESQALIGSEIDANGLLTDLRTHPGVETALHLPPGPNSGLSVMLPELQ
ncbi:MAG: hypothetical protein M1337_06360 [Actinobacteria bacterium]|nr:hypothetical protein [Actinomycetota bacterium]